MFLYRQPSTEDLEKHYVACARQTADFNVKVYANATSVSSSASYLAVGDSIAVELSWNTSGFACGNYSVVVYAEPVPGEADTKDNIVQGYFVVVSVPGDVNAMEL